MVNEDSDIWFEHSARRNDSTPYCEAVIIETTDRNGTIRKKLDMRATRNNIRNQNMMDYRRTTETVANDTEGRFFENADVNAFWIHHIENAIERITANINANKTYKLTRGYLGEKVWKDIINFISIKYIAVGKAVYHFAADDINTDSKEINIGKIISEKKGGMSSFDYEQIKAEETLQRETATYVAFAVNNLATATVNLSEKREDILLLGENALGKECKPHIRRNVLQYFGGNSLWEKSGSPFEDVSEDDTADIRLLVAIKNALYSLRNYSFHYNTADENDSEACSELIAKMFEFDSNRASSIQIEKLYSNNLPMFYSQANLEKLVGRIYAEYAERASQIPSFNKVFVRSNFAEYLRNDLRINVALNGTEELSKWHSAVYYAFKEIYYNAFIQDKSTRDLFIKKVKSLKPREDKKTDSKAIENFAMRIKEIEQANPDFSLAQICQIIMTEQNLQNGGNSKAHLTKDAGENEAIYKHYKMLLYKALRDAFMEYIDGSDFAFLKEPHEYREVSKEDFTVRSGSNIYSELSGLINEDPSLLNYYILSRMLAPRQQNFLAGSLRSYVQYSEDVERRAKQTRNSLSKDSSADRAYIRTAVRIIDMCIQISGTTSNTVADYFDNEDSFAEYVFKYYDIGSEYENVGISPAAKLKAFCNTEYAKDKRIGLFYDGENPILNRNLILAKLYGADNVISKIVKKNNKEEIEDLYRKSAEIEDYKVTGTYKSFDVLKKIKAYQEKKNKVELRDVVDYSEIINELQGQLINGSLMRERDFMYFQLGFHYYCLHNEECIKSDNYRSLTVGDKTINGAILYQIIAMYTYGLPMYVADENGSIKAVGDREQTANKVKLLGEYTLNDSGFYSTSNAGYYADAGYELFGVLEEQGNVYSLRNYIDHFHYYAKQDRSLLDIYSEVFDRFFTYDIKYQKNVINLLSSVLSSHFVDASFMLESDPVKNLKKQIGKNGNKTKEMATIRINPAQGIKSELFTYSVENEDRARNLPARSPEYLENVARILCYPNLELVTEDLIKLPRVKEDRGGHRDLGKQHGDRKRDNNYNEYQKYKKNNESVGTLSAMINIHTDIDLDKDYTCEVTQIDKKSGYGRGKLPNGEEATFKWKGTSIVNGATITVRLKKYDDRRKAYEATVVG